MTRGVGAMTSSDWHARRPQPVPVLCLVVGCGRRVGPRNRAKGAQSILPEPDCCPYCARPLTAEAIARAPRDGFLAVVRVTDRRPAMSRNVEETV